MKNIIIILSSIFLLFSCAQQENSTKVLPRVSGRAGEVILVINNSLWEGNTGEELRKIMQKGVEALPNPEPYFNLVNITPGSFTDVFKNHRNLAIVTISSEYDEPKIFVQKNVWAKPQVVLKIVAKSETELIKLIQDNNYKIQSVFLDADRNRLISYYKQYEDAAIREELIKKHNISLYIPKGYRIDVNKKNFVWISHEEPDLTQNIFIYYYNYTDTNTFTLDYLINKRNEILKNNVPGPFDGTYMTTEMKYPPEFIEINYKDRYFSQIKGLWKVENYFMGGPFINYTTLDEKNNRVVTVEGAVYAPRLDKRDYVRQLESIILTLSFPVKN